MQWRRAPDSDPTDPNGVADLLKRACGGKDARQVGGTRFLFRTSDMVTASREIERSAFLDPAVPLYVGVQESSRLMVQHAVYASIIRAGVPVQAFGVGPAPDLPGARWTDVEDDPLSLSSQWFVVRMGSNPRALVGFELDNNGGSRRTWEGFLSSDPVLVERLVEHLRELAEESVSV